MDYVYDCLCDITNYFYKLLQYPIEIIINSTKDIDSEYMQMLLSTNLGVNETLCTRLKNNQVSCMLYTALPLYYHMCKQLMNTFTTEALEEISNMTFTLVEVDCGMIKYVN